MTICAGLGEFTIDSIEDILKYPTTCDFQFYAKIFAGIFIIISLILYYNERKQGNIKPDMISSMGVSAIATIFLALAGTLVGFVQDIIFIEILVGGIIFIFIWLFKR